MEKASTQGEKLLETTKMEGKTMLDRLNTSV